jgi:Trk K+ transport system NAD-binding subunit
VEPSVLEDKNDHIVVCGLQGVGLRVVEQFYLSGTDVVVVDDDADIRFARILEGWGIAHIRRSAYIGEGLVEANIEHASAVVCVEKDDIHTLETALRVRELRPDIRIVVQLANPSVGGALERVTGPGTVLDAEALAAPSFVEACLRLQVHDLELGGENFAVVQTEVGESNYGQPTFRGYFSNLAPVAIMPRDGSELSACPGRDHSLEPGDRVAVLGTSEELAQYGLDVHALSHRTLRSVGHFRRLRLRLETVFETGNKGLAIAVATLLFLIAISTVLLRFFYRASDVHHHLSVLSSLYFTIETIATVGFGDYSFGTQSAWMKSFGIVLILFGVALVSTSFALFTNILVSRRIELSLGMREVPGMVDHVVVIGLGSVGINVVQGLVAKGQRVVVIERDSNNRYLAEARALGVPVLIADATQRQIHQMVNLHDAAAVAVLTSADLTNIETALAIRESLSERWDEVPVVLRVFDRDLAHMMEKSFGFLHVRSTSALAAPWFVGAALGLDVLSTFYVDQQPFLVGRVTVTANGGLEGLAMADLSTRTRVIALERLEGEGTLEHPPRRGTRFAGGDRAYVLGPYDELIRVLQLDRTASA